jgi:hypothetical protein
MAGCYGGHGWKDAVQQEGVPHNPENIAPTTPCEGLTGAVPEAITECQKRETARLFIILGKPEAALRVLCTTKVARDAFGVASLDCMKEAKTEKLEKQN